MPAWAVNQLARRRAEDVQALLAAADRLRDVQAGGGGDFAATAKAERDAVQKLVSVAEDVLREAGRPPTEATLERVATTLQTAAADQSARRDLERGRLVRDLEPAGFGSLLAAAAETPRAPATRRAVAPTRASEKRSISWSRDMIVVRSS